MSIKLNENVYWIKYLMEWKWNIYIEHWIQMKFSIEGNMQ